MKEVKIVFYSNLYLLGTNLLIVKNVYSRCNQQLVPIADSDARGYINSHLLPYIKLLILWHMLVDRSIYTRTEPS